MRILLHSMWETHDTCSTSLSFTSCCAGGDLLYRSLKLVIKIRVDCPFGSGEVIQKGFLNGGHSDHLGVRIGRILVIFIFVPILPIKFWLNLSFSFRRKKLNIDVQNGGHLIFSIGTMLAIFDLQVILILPIKFWVTWPFGSGEEAQNRFLRWQPCAM